MVWASWGRSKNCVNPKTTPPWSKFIQIKLVYELLSQHLKKSVFDSIRKCQFIGPKLKSISRIVPSKKIFLKKLNQPSIQNKWPISMSFEGRRMLLVKPFLRRKNGPLPDEANKDDE